MTGPLLDDVFAWALKGAFKYCDKDTGNEIIFPEVCHTAKLKTRETTSNVEKFISECCKVDFKDNNLYDERQFFWPLYEKWFQYCVDNALVEETDKVSQKVFKQTHFKRFMGTGASEPKRMINNVKKNVYLHIKVKERKDFPEEFAAYITDLEKAEAEEAKSDD